MVWKTRRNMLRATGIAIAPTGLSGIVKSINGGKQGVRIRRSVHNAIGPKDLFKIRADVLKNWASMRVLNEGSIISQPDLSNLDQILAYDLYQVNGVPHEFFGVLEEELERGYVNDEKLRSKERAIHQKADSRKKALIEGSEDNRSKRNTPAPHLPKTIDEEYDWYEMNQLNHYEYYKEDRDGNITNYEIDYVTHPYDDVCAIDVQVEPEIGGDEHDYARIKHEWNSDIADVESYGPGNTISSSTEGWTLGFTAGTSSAGLNVARTWSETNPHLDVDNQSKRSQELVRHKFEFGGDLSENTIRINNSSVAEFSDEPSPGQHAVSVAWITGYEGTSHTYTTDFHTIGNGGGGGGCYLPPCPTDKQSRK